MITYVVLPSNGLQRDGVHILVCNPRQFYPKIGGVQRTEDQGTCDNEVEQGETLGTKLVG